MNKISYDVGFLEKDEMISLLITMMRIRVFEETIADLIEKEKIITPCHLYVGQEAVATGVCAALENDDYVFGSHRSHGHYIAKGADINEGMAEIFCKMHGCSGGRGGSMHLVAPEVGILGTSSIVAGSVPLGVGAALAEKIKGSRRISVVFHGDGVPEEGVWNESLNFAAVKKLPVLFICENNLYCTHMALHERRINDNIPELAKAHGVPSISIDGNNVVEILSAVRDAVKNMRNNQGPFLIECRTYRWLGHVGPKDNLEVGLRSEEELTCWKERCPIKNFSTFLVEQNIISRKELDAVTSQVHTEISKALRFAESSPYPDVCTLLDHKYKEF